MMMMMMMMIIIIIIIKMWEKYREATVEIGYNVMKGTE